MLLYRFSFDTKYAGRPVRVFAADGSEVAGSPFTLDGMGDYAASLAEGTYTGRVDNPAVHAGDGYSVVNGVLDVPGSIAAGGGGGGDTVSRGVLYLKASAVDVDASMETWADGSGEPFALVLDTEKQGDSPIPEWASEDGGVYSIIEQGLYLTTIAGKGTVTFDSTPTLAYIDMFSNELGGTNWGWASDGSDDSAPFTPGTSNTLTLGRKDSQASAVDPSATFPVVLAGLVGDNYGDTDGNPVVNLEARLAITKVAAAPQYADADFA